jgi:integrase
MSVYTDKKSGRLYIQFDFKGTTRKKRLPEGSTEEQAEKLELEWRHELFFGPSVSENDILWEVFVDTVFLEHVEANSPASLERAILLCKESMKFFKGMTLRTIRPADVEKFKTARMKMKTRHGHERKPATIHREMAIISSVFSLAVKNEYCNKNPVALVELPKVDNIQDRILEDVDVDKFLRGFRNSVQRDICTVVLFTGLRQNDVLGLKKEHVNWQTGRITLLQGKTKRRVSQKMHPRTVEILLKRQSNGSDLYFPSYRTGKAFKSIKNGIRFACIRAEIPVLTIRDLRRTFGTQLHEDGWDDKTVADLLGHADLRSVHRYKRGKKIQEEAILSLEYKAAKCQNPTIPENATSLDVANLLKILVETRGIEPLTSAMPLQNVSPIIH